MANTQIDVDHLFTLTLGVGDTANAVIRNGPTGNRFIAEVNGGTFDGPRLKGTVVAPGGDWVHVRPDRTMRLDVRLMLVTDDGASILMTYNGVGVPQEDGSASVRSAPTFETGSEEYAWLNNVQAVGIGSTKAGTVSYEVYALI
jgi:hypothetical protein